MMCLQGRVLEDTTNNTRTTATDSPFSSPGSLSLGFAPYPSLDKVQCLNEPPLRYSSYSYSGWNSRYKLFCFAVSMAISLLSPKTHCFACKLKVVSCLFIANDFLLDTVRGSSFGQQLHLAALLHQPEQERSFINRLTHRQ